MTETNRPDRLRVRLLPVKTPSAAHLAIFGLTVEDYIALWEQQGGKCFLCRRSFNRGRPACIDHDHRTGETRGLLCHYCNRTIGWLHEDVEWLERAHSYLAYPPSRTVFDTPRRHVNAPPQEATT